VKALYDAIAAKITASPDGDTLRALISDYRPHRVPSKVACPYLVWRNVGTAVDRTNSSMFNDTIIQFSIHDDNEDSPIAVCNIYDALIALFDDVTLTVSGWTNVRTDRLSDQLLDDPDGGYEYIVQYRFYLGK